MYYRLRPPSELTWIDMPMVNDELVAEHNLDLDRLEDEWKPTEDRMFSLDLLRIALRHGVATSSGIAVHAGHTVDLGRGDELRILTQAGDEAQAAIRASASGKMMEDLIPGWTEHGLELDARIRETTERAAQEAEADLAEVLAAPVIPELAEHWRALGGTLPD